MASVPVVLREYIDRELYNTSPGLSQAETEKLASIAEGFLMNEISYNQAVTVFAECSIPSSLIGKLAHIKAVGEDPLPNPFASAAAPANKPVLTRKKAVAWTQEEDFRLLTAVSRFGCRDWRMISAFVGSGRTSSQCNQRWTRALNPAINHNPWTPGEDARLLELVGKMGCCRWRKIAELLNGRTDLQCRHRYLQLSKREDVKEEEKTAEFDPRMLEIGYFLNRPVPALPPLVVKTEKCA